MKLVTHDQVKSKIIQLRNQNVLLDSDVAELYRIETHRLNEAVKRNPEKFPEGYFIELTSEEQKSMISQSAISSKRKLTNSPKAYTERGLYMLALQKIITTKKLPIRILHKSSHHLII